jgi:hypothetical protein
MTPDILPDSRLRDQSYGEVATGHPIFGRMIPTFCANCGREGPLCSKTLTYFFYLCNGCEQKYGAPAGTMLIPDEVFNRKLVEAQMEQHGRLLEPQELGKVIEDGDSPLAKLILSGQ